MAGDGDDTVAMVVSASRGILRSLDGGRSWNVDLGGCNDLADFNIDDYSHVSLVELKGAIVTIDAIGCQKEIATKIVEGGGDYVLAVKDNQRALHTASSDHFLHLHETDIADCEVRRLTTPDNGRGWQERRTYYVTALPETMQCSSDDWEKLTSIGQVINITLHDGREVADIRYFILSSAPQIQRFAAAVRGHWGIETSLHMTLDMTFRVGVGARKSNLTAASKTFSLKRLQTDVFVVYMQPY